MEIKDLVIKANALEIPVLLGLFYFFDHRCRRSNAKPLLTWVHVFFVGRLAVAAFVDAATRTHHLKNRVSMHRIANHVGTTMNKIFFIVRCVVAKL